MITIGMMLRSELEGLTVEDKTANVDFGTQKELIRFIQDMQRSNKRVFPLIWCVVDSYDDLGDQFRARVRFILFQKTKGDFRNKDRFIETYGKILNPLYEKVKVKLISSRNVFLEGRPNEVFKGVVDADNYGVDLVKNELTKESGDFTSTSSKQTKAIAQTILDAKIFDLTLKINKISC